MNERGEGMERWRDVDEDRKKSRRQEFIFSNFIMTALTVEEREKEIKKEKTRRRKKSKDGNGLRKSERIR